MVLFILLNNVLLTFSSVDLFLFHLILSVAILYIYGYLEHNLQTKPREVKRRRKQNRTARFIIYEMLGFLSRFTIESYSPKDL